TAPTDHLLMSFLGTVLIGSLVWLAKPHLFSQQTGGRAVPPPSPAALAGCILLGVVFSPRAEDYVYPLAMTALLLMIPELRRLSVATVAAIAGAALLSWPF